MAVTAQQPQAGQSRFKTIASAIWARLPEVNFITLHYGYFIFTGLFSGIIFWGSSTPSRSVSFTDSLFLCVSAMTEAGLNTINLSTLNTWQQIILFLLIIMGSAIFVSAFVVFVRLSAFEKEFEAVVKKAKQRRQDRRGRSMTRTKSFFQRERYAPSRDAEGRALAAPNLSDEEKTIDSHKDDSRQTAQAASTDLSDKSEDVGQSPENTNDVNPGLAAPSRRITFAERQDRGRAPALAELERRDTQASSHSRMSRNWGNSPAQMRRPLWAFTGVGAVAGSTLRQRPGNISFAPPDVRAQSPVSHVSALDADLPRTIQPTDTWFQSAAGYFSRNSQVHGLSFHERQILGGKEWAAILFLSWLVPVYFIAWQFLGALAIGAWVKNYRASVAQANGLNAWWVGIFNAVSAFNNSGMSLLDANMTAFSDAIFVLVSMGLFILAGNTAYPIFLRIIIWTAWKALPDNEIWHEEKENLRFLLDHPRRCYTNLFPARHTWWLGMALIVLNGVDWALFEILNIGNSLITSIPRNLEVLDGLFQALAVRSGGFYVVPIPNLRIAVQVLYVIMMYISAYPVVITMRNSNVYEERSLGVFAEDQDKGDEDDDGDVLSQSRSMNRAETGLSKSQTQGVLGYVRHGLSFVTSGRERERNTMFLRHQVRAQLAHDIWWIVLAIFLIMIIEADNFERDPVTFSVFNVIFECVSAYGCVGISVGVPYAAYSFCGAWHTLSKLILIAVMLRGRHRGLPVAIDHAVQLPNQDMWLTEEEEGQRRLQRSLSRSNTGLA